MMIDSNIEITGLVKRCVKGEQLNEEEMAFIRWWGCLSEENQLIADLLVDKPWLDQDLQNPADVPTLAIKRTLSKQIKNNNKPKDSGAANHWLIWFAALVVVAGTVGVVLKYVKQPVAPAKEYAEQKPSFVRKIDDAAMLQFADGRIIALDTVADGSSIVASTQVSLEKIKDSLRVVGELSGQPNLWRSLSVGLHHRPLNVLFPDGSRIQLLPGAEYVSSGIRDKDHVNHLNKGKAWFAVAKNSELPFAVGLPDQTRLDVTGTSFEVDVSNARKPKILLVDGGVKVTGTAGTVVMKPMEQVILRNGYPVVGRAARDTALWGWAGVRMVFYFKHANVDDIARVLSRYYGLTVYKDDHIEGTGDLTITIKTADGPINNQEKINDFLGGAAYIKIKNDSLIISRTQ